MIETQFSQMGLDPRIEKAVEAMGFDQATDVQAQVIPLIRGGADVIAKSQTGTGKTAAFAIPALESIDTKEEKPTIQTLILCPTRELAQQAGEEILKLARFLPGIRLVQVYGGANMERQFIQLRRANIVVGTPGRVMDHMRRGTIKLKSLKMIVLDEADEMLNMGFKEDIETILRDTPEGRQTVLFSATMPPAILTIAKTFQKDPQTVEINKDQVTLEQIDQSCVEVPVSKKMEALNLLLRYHKPNRALVFCNTKHMVDELGEYLNGHGFSAESIHGDLKQAQRTRVMNEFKRGRVAILIATDVAARGIDVNDLDYVINYDIPMNTEYYVHRIGRTGRAGKQGSSITIFSGKRQMYALRELSRAVKSEIRQDALPTQAEIEAREHERNVEAVAEALDQGAGADYEGMTDQLVARGYTAEQIASALLSLHFPREALPAELISRPSRSVSTDTDKRPAKAAPASFADVVVDVGSAHRVEAKHLVGAITERSGISGKEVGKINIYPDYSVVGVPADRVHDVVESMRDCKIRGKQTSTIRLTETPRTEKRAAHKESKSIQFSSRRVAECNAARGAEPTRRKRRIPDFEG
ncbi:MAG: DEAD/DEAH box helicase [Clostridia bacterium]|nr:DEAD/DEAH box helicase [Clostridia bacterium]